MILSCKRLQYIFALVKAGQYSTTWQIQLCVSCCYQQQFGLFYRRQRYRHRIQVSNKEAESLVKLDSSTHEHYSRQTFVCSESSESYDISSVFFVPKRAEFGKYLENLLQIAILDYEFQMISDYGFSCMLNATNFFTDFRVGFQDARRMLNHLLPSCFTILAVLGPFRRVLFCCNTASLYGYLCAGLMRSSLRLWC